MRSVVGHAEHSSTSANPVLRVNFRLELQVHDEVSGVASGSQFSSSLTGLVKRTVIHAVSLDLIFKHWLEPDDREESNRHLMIHLINGSAFVLPLGTLNVTTIDVYTSVWRESDTFKSSFSNVGLEVKFVNFKGVLTGMHLESSSLESLREEEAGNPVTLRRAISNPVTHESNAFKKVIKPRVERLKGRIGPFDPHVRNFSIKEVEEHKFKV